MALEPITRQEQIIAGKDLEPITRMEKFLKEYGGASSWNDLKDKPFGEIPEELLLSWNGDMTGRVCIDLSLIGREGQYYVRVSDKPYTKEELDGTESVLNNGVKTTYSGLASFTTNIPGSFEENGDNSIIAVIYDADEFNSAAGAPSGYYQNGTYFFAWPSMNIYTSKLVRVAYTKRLDEKYAPVFTSPNGQKYRIAVNDNGNLFAVKFYD